jgi:hypothetical protein
MSMQVFVVDNAIGELQPRNIPVTLVAALEGDAFHERLQKGFHAISEPAKKALRAYKYQPFWMV